MYEDICKCKEKKKDIYINVYIKKEKKRYLSVPKRKEKSICVRFSRYPCSLLSAVRFFTMAMRRLSMSVG